MKKSFFLTMAIAALLTVFAIGCTTTRMYDEGRYGERVPYGYYDRYGIYDPYGYYGYPMTAYPQRYYGDRYYYGNRNPRIIRQNPEYRERNAERAKQYEEQRKESVRKIEDSRSKVLGRGN